MIRIDDSIVMYGLEEITEVIAYEECKTFGITSMYFVNIYQDLLALELVGCLDAPFPRISVSLVDTYR